MSHVSPHFECLTDVTCDGLNEPGVGHVCVCDCKECTTGRVRLKVKACICKDCDRARCGLHVEPVVATR